MTIPHDNTTRSNSTHPANAVLLAMELALVRTPTEREAFDWAYWPTLEMAEDEENDDDIAKEGILEWVRTDMMYRLGEQLQDMTEDTVGTPERHKALALARVAVNLTEKIREYRLDKSWNALGRCAVELAQ